MFGPSLVEKTCLTCPLSFAICICVCVGYLPHELLQEKHPNIHQNSKTQMKIRLFCFCMTNLFLSVFSPQRRGQGVSVCMTEGGNDIGQDIQTVSRLRLVLKPYAFQVSVSDWSSTGTLIRKASAGFCVCVAFKLQLLRHFFLEV